MKEKVNTKDKLIRAGIKLFSKYGYAATSTRMIAAEAGVNLSAIAFHYTNKECLYQACLNYIVEKIREYYSPIREKIEINPKEPRYLKVVWGVGYKIEKQS